MLLCRGKKKEKDFKIAFGRYGFWIQMSITLSENITWDAHVVSTFSTCTGVGNSNPFQCSWLENPRDGEPGGLPSMGLHRVGHD